MLKSKYLLFALAAAWIAFGGMEKFSHLSDTMKQKKKPVPLKIGFRLFRLVRSLVVTCLVLVNILLALSVIDTRK